MNRTKEFRREKESISKKRAKNYLKMTSLSDSSQKNDPKQIGRMASTHCRPCSCYMCGNPRRHWNEITVEEKRSEEDFKEVLKEII